jgi:hypothetical protein
VELICLSSIRRLRAVTSCQVVDDGVGPGGGKPVLHRYQGFRRGGVGRMSLSSDATDIGTSEIQRLIISPGSDRYG